MNVLSRAEEIVILLLLEKAAKGGCPQARAILKMVKPRM